MALWGTLAGTLAGTPQKARRIWGRFYEVK